MRTKVESNLLSCGSDFKRQCKLTTGRRHMTFEERAECVRLYVEGAAIKQIAYRFDCHRTIIGRLIKSAGVKRGHKFRAKKGVKHMDQRELEKLANEAAEFAVMLLQAHLDLLLRMITPGAADLQCCRRPWESDCDFCGRVEIGLCKLKGMTT